MIIWLRAIRRVCILYKQVHGRWPHLLRPRRFTEKMQWRKLFDANPIFAVFCDKLATRDFIAARIGGAYLAPLYWSGTADAIPENLAPPYFLKSSHASGQVIHVTAENARDMPAIRARAAAWLDICYFEQSGEIGYKSVPRRLMAEEPLLAENGGPPVERRLFVFGGMVAVINTVLVEDGSIRNGAFHTPDWTRQNWYFSRLMAGEFPRPRRLDDMIRIAGILGAGLDHIRVDFFDCGDRLFVGELTAYSWGGLARFNNAAADLALGRYWTIASPGRRALHAILFRTR